MTPDDELIARYHAGDSLTAEQWAQVNAILDAAERDNALSGTERARRFKTNQKARNRIRRDYWGSAEEHDMLASALRAYREKTEK